MIHLDLKIGSVVHYVASNGDHHMLWVTTVHNQGGGIISGLEVIPVGGLWTVLTGFVQRLEIEFDNDEKANGTWHYPETTFPE